MAHAWLWVNLTYFFAFQLQLFNRCCTLPRTTWYVLFFVDGNLAYPYQLIKQANDILREGEIITRTTVQIEPYDEYSAKSCKQCLHPAPSTYTTPNTNDII